MTARRSRPSARDQRGMTLLEIMVSISILVVMLAMTWSTLTSASRIQRISEAAQARNHELRVALARVVADFEAVYLSKNEDENALQRRTLLKVTSGGRVPEVRMSTLGHRNYWADANESDQTVVSYLAAPDREDGRKTNWLRREQRRVSNLNPDEEPAEYDVLVRGVDEVKLELWDWANEKWLDGWDTTSADGQKNKLPQRVRITVTVRDDDDQPFSLSTQARLVLAEQLNFQVN
ncbi:MAG: type II secretion system protein GspJ [Kofleriaceae bacterium]